MYTTVVVVAIVIMLVGLLGTLLPFLPGLPLIWVTVLAFAWWDGFRHVSGWFVMTALAVVVVAQVTERMVTAWGSRRFGGSRAGAWGAFFGSIAGLFFLPLGLIFGPFAGAVVGELLAGSDGRRSFRSGIGSVVGVFGGIAVNFILALAMIVAFATQALGGA